ncbi:MAG TPA: pyridoxal 5'-phosphate synthase glutaminase subunit PdxT [Methanothermococcus okinawensis]|uniref:Pyridoxal 5'-phosphate synthase subunit PdxT n=1 Tax=Methanothermococcus okinawensis TaxID=155863 RepID=A0A832ZBX6_9EURY|nr:pyridoxal 5'-phosphate synthase glutaminase subunit PdxT [Methanothermococcus okinawensis]
MNIGVLAIQGDIEEQEEMVRKIGHTPVRVRRVEDLSKVEALIIPGGESTTIGKLMEKYGFMEVLRGGDIPILGICAGMVLLSKDVIGKKPPLLGLMNIVVRRNAYGSQRESFEDDIYFNGEKIRGIFIRAPVVEKILSDKVEVIAKEGDNIVGVREGKYMAVAFHPELSEDGYKVYEYFVEEVCSP